MANQRQNSQEMSSGPYNKAGNGRSQNSNYSQNSYQNTAPPTNPSYGQKFQKNFIEPVSSKVILLLLRLFNNQKSQINFQG